MTDATNWRDLPAGRELDRVIAEQVGWRVMSREGCFNLEYQGETIDRCVASDYVNIDVIWKWVLNDSYTARIPCYSTDLNAAIDLFEGISSDDTPRLVRMLRPQGEMLYSWKAGVIIYGPGQRAEVEAEADAPALAVCRAWLAYREASR